MPGERHTENLLEQALRQAGFSDDDFQFQGANDPEIQRLLPSKSKGVDGKGRPEHIIMLNGDAADILVTECKADMSKHASAPDSRETPRAKVQNCAEDGVISYMTGLLREFNVIGLAVSGTDSNLKITTFKAMRGGSIERLGTTAVLSRGDYLKMLRNSAGYGNKTEAEIVAFSKVLHEHLRDHVELSEAFKPLLVSGILLGLKDPGFEAGYGGYVDEDSLATNLFGAIDHRFA